MAKRQRFASTERATEADAYIFIRECLKEQGWTTKPPGSGGQVWTQNQCLSHPEIKRCLALSRPENIIKLNESQLWIVEAKRERAQLEQALREAEKDYAKPIQEGGVLAVPLITGVAGNDSTGYEIRTRLLVRGKYKPVTINGQEATGFLSPSTVADLLRTGDPNIADVQIETSLFLRAAEFINRTLHIGGINKNDRARVMAALLLALLEEPGPAVESELLVLVDDINTRTKAVLRKHGKTEFHPFVRIEPPTNSENHVKYRAAIIHTIQELKNLSIKSAMNSGADVLGQFYEVFLKYGNGAKEIGIVLTPRHVARFGVEVLGVGPQDIVLDPACGTGGFLVAAFDQVRKTASRAQIDRFKQFSLFGIERESYVAALAIVNMIFRGDGKNNIVEANCFSKHLSRTSVRGNPTAEYRTTKTAPGEEAITKVLMNPPFALKETDEKEYRFIEVGLESLVDGGLLFAIVPMSVFSEAGKEGSWRRDSLLAHHTLVAVISLPEELFYPVANQTVAVIVRKGTPHPRNQKVFWGRVEFDGFRKSKGKRLEDKRSGTNDLIRIAPLLKAFISDGRVPRNQPKFVKAAPIDYKDPILELVPEAYIESVIPNSLELHSHLDEQIRENVASIVTVDLKYIPGRLSIIETSVGARPTLPAPSATGTLARPVFRDYQMQDLFQLWSGDFHSLSDELDSGEICVISCADSNNGVIGIYDVPPANQYKDALTIAFNGWPLTTKMHPYAFGAKDDVAVGIPLQNTIPIEALVYIQMVLNGERWRFSYYRKCFRAKLERLTLKLPATATGELDTAFMVNAVRSQPYWWFLSPRLASWCPETPVVALSR